MIYTYRPFFLLTLLHPSQSFLTELRTFMPRTCCASGPDTIGAVICVPSRSPAKRVRRLLVWDCESVGRAFVWRERTGVRTAKRVRRTGRRSARGSILVVASWWMGASEVGSWRGWGLRCVDLDGEGAGGGKCCLVRYARTWAEVWMRSITITVGDEFLEVWLNASCGLFGYHYAHAPSILHCGCIGSSHRPVL